MSEEGAAGRTKGEAPRTGHSGDAHAARRHGQHSNAERITDPKQLRVLVVDSKGSSRTAVCSLLRDCEYQVTSVKTSAEALHFLVTGQQPSVGEQSGGTQQPPPPEAQHVDLVIKEHEPPDADAGRLLKKMARSELLRKIPVVVMSSQDDREVVMHCLTLGAIDYLVKPLRHNELRHIWTRVWWWRRSGLGAPAQHVHAPRATRAHDMSSYQSSESKETKCDDEEEPTSKEGSAPDANNGSNGNGHGSNGHGSKDGNGTSRVDAKPHDTGNGNGNGSSDNKNGHHGSNGNGASTTLAVERNGAHPLAHTAEGRAPQGLAPLESQAMCKVATGRSALFPGEGYTNTPLTTGSRKRAFNILADTTQSPTAPAGGHLTAALSEPVPKVSKVAGAGGHSRERHERTAGGGVGGAGGAAGGSGGAPSSSRGTGTGTGTGTGSQPASKPHSGHEQHQVAHGTGPSAVGLHGSGGSRVAVGHTGGTAGSSGQDGTGTGTVSGAHFGGPLPTHHLQPSLPASVTHMASWGSLAVPPGSQHLGPGPPGTSSQPGAAFPPTFPPSGLPPHLLAQPLHALSMYQASPSVSGAPQDLHTFNPMLAATNYLHALQLNQQNLMSQQRAPQLSGPQGTATQVGVDVEGSSTGMMASGQGATGGGATGGAAGESSGGLPSAPTPGLPGGLPGAPQLVLQYLNALAQLGTGAPGMPPASAHSVGSAAQAAAAMAALTAGAGALPGGAPAAWAAAWAAAGPPGLFLPPGAAAPHPHHPPPPHLSSSSHSLPPPLPLPVHLAMSQHTSSPVAAAHAAGNANTSSGMPSTASRPQPLHPPLANQTGLPPPQGLDASLSSRPMDVAARQALLMAGIGPMAPFMLPGLPGLGLPLPAPPAPAGSLPPPPAPPQGPLPPTASGPVAGGIGGVAVAGVVVGGGEPSTRRRRALALDKYRQKRKNLKFSSAIRYENRKVQAQSRPRIKGQFAKAQPAQDAGGEGGAVCGGVDDMREGGDEEDEDMTPVAGAGQEEDEEYDAGVDDDDNDRDDDDNGNDGLEGAHTAAAAATNMLAQLAAAAAAGAGPAGLAHKRQRSLSQLNGQQGGEGGPPAAKRWSSRHRGRVGSGAHGGSGDRRSKGGQEGAGEHPQGALVAEDGNTAEEEDVVDSLRELKEGRRLQAKADGHPHTHRHHRHGGASAELMAGTSGARGHGGGGAGEDALGAAVTGTAQTGAGTGGGGGAAAPQTSMSLGSQSGLAASKGSHGRTSQRGGGNTRVGSGMHDAEGGCRDPVGGGGNAPGGVGPSQRVSSHGREGAASRGMSSHNDALHTASNQNNGKNGSDSGSNSPDENGNGGATDPPPPPPPPPSRGAGVGHGKPHRHDAGSGGAGSGGPR